MQKFIIEYPLESHIIVNLEFFKTKADDFFIIGVSKAQDIENGTNLLLKHVVLSAADLDRILQNIDKLCLKVLWILFDKLNEFEVKAHVLLELVEILFVLIEFYYFIEFELEKSVRILFILLLIDLLITDGFQQQHHEFREQ